MLILYRMDFFFFFSSVFFLSFTRLPALTQFSACRITIPMCCLCLLLLLLLLVHILSLAKLEKKIFLLSNRKVSIFHWALCSLAAFFSLLSFAPFFFAYFSSMCCFFGGGDGGGGVVVVIVVFFVPFFIVKSSFRKKNDIKQVILVRERGRKRESKIWCSKKCVRLALCVQKVKDLQATVADTKKSLFLPFSLSRSRFVRQNVNPILSS